MQKEKRKWNTPEVRSFGAFETATQDCTNKTSGFSDGLNLAGVGAIGCAS